MNYIGTFIKNEDGIQISLDHEYDGRKEFDIKMSDYRGSVTNLDGERLADGNKIISETYIILVDGYNLGIGCDLSKEFKVGNKTIAPIFDIGPM